MGSATVIEGIDYGPLAALVGVWKGDKGLDLSPEPDGIERNPYYEVITFELAGDVTNAEEQTLSVVRYHQVVSRKSNDEVFHDQVGYWLWDPADNTIVENFTIPRGVAVVAGGKQAAPESWDEELVFDHVWRIYKMNEIILKNGEFLKAQADTFCVHSDTPSAVQILQYLQRKLAAEKIYIKS